PFHMDRAPDAWPYYQFLLILPLLILLNIKLKNARTTKSTLVILLIVFFISLTSILLFPRRIIIPVFYPSLLIISFGITRGFVEWMNSRRLAAETQNAFSRFISADIVSQIVNNPDAIKPGGEKKELTVMFTDIAGFTSISEKLDADALTELMNSYLDEMTKILFKNGGTLDKYIGDAIMGFWNHPTTMEDHATRAVTCAIEMQKKLKEMRENWIAQGLPKVEMRAGINTGTCMVGFIGSKIQMNFTCLGDNVNLASRLEGANKAYGTFIMISEPVKKQLNPYLFSTRFLDFLAVKGKNEPVLVYEVRGWQNEETQVWKEKAGELYQNGIDKYLAREWNKAIELFEEVLKLVPDDAPSKVYIDRCKHFKQEPPEENWDGRFILKTK
ncbi:MAG: adenylate/guanylate cyclase domain-containing protein, partial [Candidatus Riflebacteria bacterium]|nr:adenylate/guanylate cyclase domain-containing protein [Candidatus Riflebacteria bacterium]